MCQGAGVPAGYVFFRADFLLLCMDSCRVMLSASLGCSLSFLGIILHRLAVVVILSERGSFHFLFPFLGMHSDLLLS